MCTEGLQKIKKKGLQKMCKKTFTEMSKTMHFPDIFKMPSVPQNAQCAATPY